MSKSTLYNRVRNSPTTKRIAIASALLLGSAVSASAQTTPTVGLGADGAPQPADYLTAAHAFQAAIAPILAVLLTFLLALWGVWNGPSIIKRLLSKYARG